MYVVGETATSPSLKGVALHPCDPCRLYVPATLAGQLELVWVQLRCPGAHGVGTIQENGWLALEWPSQGGPWYTSMGSHWQDSWLELKLVWTRGLRQAKVAL